jgi:hypothetical protein
MAQDFGIIITAPGVAVRDAKPNQVLMNTSHPFIKIDTQTKTGFQTILLLITTDPPEPVGPATDTYTVVYQFAHGYKYAPAVETLFNVTSPPPGSVGTQSFFLDSGIIGAHTAFDSVQLYAVTDATYVYFVVHKYNDGVFGMANLLTGTVVQISTHVFVEDTGT